jgi:hypothetical protein
MSTPPADSSLPAVPTPPGVSPTPADASHAEDLDPEEDVAPNLGGEDQMQDA